MTVTTNTSRISYTGDGASTVFAVPFIFLDNADINVYVNGIQVGTGFTTTGAGVGTGNVTFAVAPAAAAVVLLVRNPDFLQNTDLPSNGSFPSAAVEQLGDKAMIGLQRISDLQGRSLTLGDGDSPAVMTLPLTEARAANLLAFDAHGLPAVPPFTTAQVASAVAAAYLGGAATTLDAVAFVQAGTGAVSRSSQAKMREWVTPEDFGAVGDGVTDDNTALVNFFAAMQGRIGVLGPKTYYTATLIETAFANCQLIGTPGASKITSDYSNPASPEQAGFLKLLDITNFDMSGVEFESTLVSATLDTGSALVFSFQNNVTNSSFRRCKFTAPNANTSGLSFFTRTTAADLAHTINGLWIEDCDFQDLGSIGSTIMNRSTDLTAAQRVYFNRNKGKNLGLSASFGFLVSFDGYGQHFTCDDNLVENGYGIGIENTNWSYGRFAGNRFRDFQAGRAWAPMSFSGSMSGLTIADNRTLEAANERSNFIGVHDSQFRGNYFQAAGDYPFTLRDATGNRFYGDTYKSDNIYAALIGTTGVTTSSNRWDACLFDTTASAANSSVVRFDGATTTDNLLDNCTLLKGTGGVLGDQINSAVSNFIDSYDDGTASPAASNYKLVTLTDADFTVTGFDAMARRAAYRFNGTLTASRTVTFPDNTLDFLFWNNTSFDLSVKSASSGALTVYAGQRVAITNSGTSLLAWGALSSAWNGVQILTMGANRQWVDATGKVLTKAGAPASATDGTSVGFSGTQTTVGAAGGASALPATPTGFVKIRISGTEFVVPYYAAV